MKRPAGERSKGLFTQADEVRIRPTIEGTRKRLYALEAGTFPPALIPHAPCGGRLMTGCGVAQPSIPTALLDNLEAPPGFEPGVEVLQTSALPLGDGAL